MLFVRDKGRMCNNILQYAHVYAWGREHHVKTISMRFAYKYQYFHICNTPGHWFWVYTLAKMLAKAKLIPTLSFHLEHADYTLNEQKMLHKPFALVEGWHAKYYDLYIKYKPEIIQLFSFHPEIEQQTNAFIEQNNAEIRLGIHIRRGDYVNFHNGKYFFNDDVYINYIKAFCHLHKDKKVVVYLCTNDKQLNRAYYTQQLQNIATVAPMLKGKHGEALDLCLLSKCHYLIGAPSTFSLVAAMYNDLPLLWMPNADAQSVENPNSWGKFDYLFKHII